MKANLGFMNFRQSLEFKEFSNRLPLEFNAPINAAIVNIKYFNYSTFITCVLLRPPPHAPIVKSKLHCSRC